MRASRSRKPPAVVDILKTDNIFHFLDTQPLSQALPKLTSSHDAAFVFNQKDKLIGVVSPYHLFRTRSLHGSSKLKSCAKMPPKLHKETSLPQVAQAMLESKIHYLPVVNGKFEGIVTIRRLLEHVVNHHFVNNHGNITFSNRELITITPEKTVSQALALMKQEKVSKLPVVARQGVLVGLISQFDLRELVQDAESVGRQDRSGEKKARMDEPITDYMVKPVETVSRLPSFAQAVTKMLEKNIGSLVVVDSHNVPMGIVTKIDLLQTIASSRTLINS